VRGPAVPRTSKLVSEHIIANALTDVDDSPQVGFWEISGDDCGDSARAKGSPAATERAEDANADF